MEQCCEEFSFPHAHATMDVKHPRQPREEDDDDDEEEKYLEMDESGRYGKVRRFV